MARTKPLSSMRRLLPLSLASLARAGHWEVTYSGDSASGDHPKQYAWDGSNYSAAGVNVYGTVVATFKWTPDYPSDSSAPLDHAYVLETCSASGSNDNSNNPHFNAPAADADNGLRSGTVRQANHPYGNSSGYVVYTATSRGTRVTYHNIGSTREFQVSCSPTAQGGMNYGSAVVTYRAEVTPYALSIHSDRDESFHKAPGGLPESNLNDVLTPRWGDTWIDPSASGAQDPFTGIYRYWFGFTGEAIGFGSGFTPSWDLWGTTSSAWNQETQWVDFMPLDLAALSDNPIQRVVTLSATDSNGVSATATCTLRIHHPYEGWHKIGELSDMTDQVGDLMPEAPGVAFAHGTIHCTWNNPGPFWKLLSVVTTVGSADVSGSLWKYFFKAAQIGLADLGPKPDGGSASFDNCWGTSESTISDGNWSSDKTQYQMAPRLVRKYHAHKYEADGYDVHGYVGPVREGASDPNPFAKQWAGEFTRIVRNPGGGGGS